MREPVNAICEQQRCRSACTDSLISAFVVRCLDSIIRLVSIPEISSLYLASMAAQAGFCLPWSQTPKTGFPVLRFICRKTFCSDRLQEIGFFVSFRHRTKCSLTFLCVYFDKILHTH